MELTLLSLSIQTVKKRAAIQLKILIAINQVIKIVNRDYSRLIATEQVPQVCGTE